MLSLNNAAFSSFVGLLLICFCVIRDNMQMYSMVYKNSYLFVWFTSFTMIIISVLCRIITILMRIEWV